jgi:cytochrome c556
MKKLALFSLALWLLTIGVLGYFFIRGSTQTSSDNRQAVLLSPAEKNMVLGEMRTILKAVDGVINALPDKNLATASAAARSAGMSMAVDASPGLIAKLPIQFKALGMSLHKDFDDLASGIEKGIPERQIIQHLGKITNKCIACHSAYRFSE